MGARLLSSNEATCDATWTLGVPDDMRIEDLPPLQDLARRDSDGVELVTRDLYSYAITYGGAVVAHATHNLG